MAEQVQTTRILFVDSDEQSFEVRQCVARVLAALPPVELFHAKDATEALSLLDEVKPDVVVIDDEQTAECDLFMDSVGANHPPIVVRTETRKPDPKTFTLDEDVTYIPKSETLEGIHQTLMLVTAIGVRANQRVSRAVH